MSVINRRNAILGWSVWQVGKMTAKHKAKQAVQPESKSRRPGKRAAISAVAAAGGALWFWRHRNGDDGES
jgi:ferric-dicitrate binding protein FerR (iron transport regulator)